MALIRAALLLTMRGWRKPIDNNVSGTLQPGFYVWHYLLDNDPERSR